MRVVTCMTVRSISIEKRPLSMVRMSPPAAPTDAASVGEATPTKIDPNTPTISTKAGKRARPTRFAASARKAAISAASIAGASWGFHHEMTAR